MLFEIDVMLCKAFPAWTPVSIRREPGTEIIRTIKQLEQRGQRTEGQAAQAGLKTNGGSQRKKVYADAGWY